MSIIPANAGASKKIEKNLQSIVSHYEACKQNYTIVCDTFKAVDKAFPDAVASMVRIYNKIGSSELNQSTKYDLEGRFKSAARVSYLQQYFDVAVFSELRSVLKYPVIIIITHSF